MNPDLIALHKAPVWLEQIDSNVFAKLPEEGRYEQIWAQRVADNLFRICCIPFFTYGIALGDIVNTVSENEVEYQISKVQDRSGRAVFRVYFEVPKYRFRQQVSDELSERGALLEWSSGSMFAVDAHDQAHAQSIEEYLNKQESLARLIYENG